MKRFALSLLAVCLTLPSWGQYAWQYEEHPVKSKLDLANGLRYTGEAQGALSHGKTPLWLNANRYGLSSLKEGNGYLRGRIERPLSTDSVRRWGVGYGLDAAVAAGFTSTLVVQQAYVEGRWLHGVLTIGEKEWPMELKNNRLSSGSQTLGINARPVPQVRLALPEYWTIPGTHRWLHFKGHIAYGMTTDQNWQHDFTRREHPYTDKMFYHSKSGFLKLGNDDTFFPLSIEAGVEFGAQFGGDSYLSDGAGGLRKVSNRKGWRSFWRAFVPGGDDIGEGGTVYRNEEGNILGSWMARITYDADLFRLAVYGDKYFEDHSGMFLLDYDGYGTGDEWDVRKKSKYMLYSPKDLMLGLELNLKSATWLRDIVFEYLYTKYQSGPIYHDHTPSLSDHIGGRDDYYNHGIFQAWQHWGQVIGNPLFRSPIYNDDGLIYVKDNRFVSWHLGLGGQPTESLSYRLLASLQTGYGTYSMPYTHKRHNVSVMAEATYCLPKGWTVTGAYGMDAGSILGHNQGFQLTVAKAGLIK